MGSISLSGGLLTYFRVQAVLAILVKVPSKVYGEGLAYRFLVSPDDAPPPLCPNHVSRVSYPCAVGCFFFFIFRDLGSFVEDAIAIGNALTLRRLLNEVS